MLYNIYSEMIRGNFSFLILVASVVQIVIMSVNLHFTLKNRR